MNCIWTAHAEERQREWQRKLGVTREEVEEVARNPEQIVPGDRGALVAQSRRGSCLLLKSDRYARSDVKNLLIVQ